MLLSESAFWIGMTIYVACVTVFGVCMYLKDRRRRSGPFRSQKSPISQNRAEDSWSQHQRELLGLHIAGANERCSRGFSMKDM